MYPGGTRDTSNLSFHLDSWQCPNLGRVENYFKDIPLYSRIVSVIAFSTGNLSMLDAP